MKLLRRVRAPIVEPVLAPLHPRPGGLTLCLTRPLHDSTRNLQEERMNARHTWVAVAGLLVIGQDVLRAQTPRPPARLWSVSVAVGTGSGRSFQDVEAAMRAGGFDDRKPPCMGPFCFSDETAYPISLSKQGNPTLLLTVRRRFGRTAHIRALMGSVTLGETLGYDADANASVILKQSVTTYAIMGGIETDDGPWIAAGPAVYRVALERISLRLGAVLAAGLVLPARKRFFVEFQGQFRLVGTVDLGPINVDGIGGGSAGTLPRTGVNFNHSVVLLGVGFRL